MWASFIFWYAKIIICSDESWYWLEAGWGICCHVFAASSTGSDYACYGGYWCSDSVWCSGFRFQLISSVSIKSEVVKFFFMGWIYLMCKLKKIKKRWSGLVVYTILFFKAGVIFRKTRVSFLFTVVDLSIFVSLSGFRKQTQTFTDAVPVLTFPVEEYGFCSKEWTQQLCETASGTSFEN